ncbi:MAG: energy transducer TonB [Bacteroidia bacterium]|nr:energy transducer TonB [Bacteroidia bacterium]
MKKFTLFWSFILFLLPGIYAQSFFYKGITLTREQLLAEIYQDILDGREEGQTICEAGINRAIEDASLGKYTYYYFGYPTPDYTAYLWVLKNMYNVQTVSGGDAENIEKQCYNAVIGESLRERYGQSFWTDVAQKADSINNSGMSENEVWNFIACNLRLIPYAEGTTTPLVMVKCVTDDAGNLKESSVYKSWQTDFDTEALRVIRSIPKWQPIAKTVVIPVVFDENNKNKCKN